ncbi:MAG: uracil-DNA glycosylase [Acidobacteria bacterium]|nr:uracil-DNA glycosylase [Acidobacteriota bacterium]
MDERLRKEVANWLEFYREMGIGELDLHGSGSAIHHEATQPASPAHRPPATSHPDHDGARKQLEGQKTQPPLQTVHAAVREPMPKSLSLFESISSIPREKETLEEIRKDLGDCHRCRLSSGRKTIVFGQGNPHAEVVFVGEGPGADEDAQGLPFVGRAGQLLNRMIQLVGMKREEVYICNVVKCRPPGNRTPLPDEIEICSPFLLRQIRTIGPRLVCCLGAPAVRTVLGIKEGITKIRGQFYDFGDIKALPIFHPAYILRNPREEKLLREDFQKVCDFLKSSR